MNQNSGKGKTGMNLQRWMYMDAGIICTGAYSIRTGAHERFLAGNEIFFTGNESYLAGKESCLAGNESLSIGDESLLSARLKHVCVSPNDGDVRINSI
jgi:hypothetical protein